MTIRARRLRASLTRLVLVGTMAATLAAGGVAVGPRPEAAARPNTAGCAAILSKAEFNRRTGHILLDLGYSEAALPYLARANAYQDAYNSLC